MKQLKFIESISNPQLMYLNVFNELKNKTLHQHTSINNKYLQSTCKSHIAFGIYTLLMRAQDRAESTRVPISYENSINQFPLDTIKSMWQLERTYTKMCRQKMSIFFNEIYIYIYCHPQTDCFVLSELFSVARHAGRLMPWSKPVQHHVRLSLRPLGQQADHVG